MEFRFMKGEKHGRSPKNCQTLIYNGKKQWYTPKQMQFLNKYVA